MNKDFEKVDAKIIGANGNVYNLLAICQRALRDNGYNDEAKELYERVTNSECYNVALSIMQEYVNPISVNEMDLESDENSYEFD